MNYETLKTANNPFSLTLYHLDWDKNITWNVTA